MLQVPRRPAIRPVIRRAQPSLSQVKQSVAASTVAQAGKERAQGVLSRIRGAAPPGVGGPLLEEFLETLNAGGDEGEELAQQIIDRAREELDRRRQLCSPLLELLRPFRAPQSRMQFVQEVLRPAQSRQVSSSQAWDRVDRFYSTPTASRRVLWFAESKLGPLTIGFSVGAEGGAGVGLEGGLGIAGLRHHCACFFRTYTVAVGAYAEINASFQIGVSPGVPEAGRSAGLTLDVSLGAAFGVAGEVTVSLSPSIKRPSLAQPYIVEYKWGGLGVSVGVGPPGGGCALGLTLATSQTLAGKAS